MSDRHSKQRIPSENQAKKIFSGNVLDAMERHEFESQMPGCMSKIFLSFVEEWIAHSIVEREDTGANPVRSFDDNHTRKLTHFEAILRS